MVRRPYRWLRLGRVSHNLPLAPDENFLLLGQIAAGQSRQNFCRFCGQENVPASIRDAQNLPLLLETAVELARRKAVIEPGIVVPQGYQGRVQYLLPICLTDMENPDLAMTLTIMDGYYLGNTCLTLEMAYLNARLLARPVAPWLAELVM